MVDEQFLIDRRNASKEEVDEALMLLAKKRERDDKIRRGVIKGSSGKKYSEMTDEQKAKSREYNRKRQVKINLLAKKAVDSGIVVTDEEVNAYMQSSR